MIITYVILIRLVTRLPLQTTFFYLLVSLGHYMLHCKGVATCQSGLTVRSCSTEAQYSDKFKLAGPKRVYRVFNIPSVDSVREKNLRTTRTELNSV